MYAIPRFIKRYRKTLDYTLCIEILRVLWDCPLRRILIDPWYAGAVPAAHIVERANHRDENPIRDGIPLVSGTNG